MPDDLRDGRFPAGTVVFLVGMRINAFWRVWSWLPVFLAMPRMLAELFRHRDRGMLDSRTELAWRRVTVVQYWASMEQVMAYAAAREHEHRPAWTAFNRRARRARGAVGIWHEAYTVDPATSHIVYRGMPPFGMAKATVSVAAGGPNARERP
jgi:hypothetical protein